MKQSRRNREKQEHSKSSNKPIISAYGEKVRRQIQEFRENEKLALDGKALEQLDKLLQNKR
jgi:hypothetical protein